MSENETFSPEELKELIAFLKKNPPDDRPKTKPINTRENNRAADIVLKKWAKTYNSIDGREARRDTGNAGKPGKPSGLIELLDMTEDYYDYIQGVIAKMELRHRRFIIIHYITRPKALEFLKNKYPQYKIENDGEYNHRIKEHYLKRVGKPRSTYDRHLSKAKFNFMAQGGLL